MKTIAFLVAMLISSIIANAQDSEGITITVTVENVHNNKGNILTSLYSQETFMRGPGIKNKKEKAQKRCNDLHFPQCTTWQIRYFVYARSQ